MKRIFITALVVLFPLMGAGTSPAGPIGQKISGKVIRKTSGKLVLSLGSFELGGMERVRLKNRITGEEFQVGISAVYDDLSYTDSLKPEIYDRIEPANYQCYVNWEIPSDLRAMEDLLYRIHNYENRLRKVLGKKVLSSGERVSSRFVIAKILKFHRVAAEIVKKIYREATRNDRYDIFIHPIYFEYEFNPDVEKAFRGNRLSLSLAARGILFEEYGRTLWFEYGFSEELVDLLYTVPYVVKNWQINHEGEKESFFIAAPYMKIPPEVINAGWYIHRQGIAKEVSRSVKLGLLNEGIIREKDLLRTVFHNGWVLGVSGERLILSFAFPFVVPGDRVSISLDGGRKLKLKIFKAEKGKPYSLTEKVEGESIEAGESLYPARRLFGSDR